MLGWKYLKVTNENFPELGVYMESDTGRTHCVQSGTNEKKIKLA